MLGRLDLLRLCNRLWGLGGLRNLSRRLNRLCRGLGLLRSSYNVGLLNYSFEDGIYAV